MASGYIGKISAVVTANTSDLSRKLQGSVKDVDKFAKAIQKSVNGSATQAQQSLERIFTPLQSLERKLRTSLSKTLDLNLPVDKIRALVSAAEQINKPLERAAKQFGQLSVEVQSGFFPALQRAQDAAVGVNNAIESTGRVSSRSFGQAKVEVDAVTQALSRLSQAQALAGRSLTGGELQFKNPLLFQTLGAAADTTQKAGALPASRLADGSIASQVQALQQYQQAAIKAQATLESISLSPNVDPGLLEAQKRRVDSLVETVRRAQVELENIVAGDAVGFVGPPKPFSDTDPGGRSIVERLNDIKNAEDRTKQAAVERANESIALITQEEVALDKVRQKLDAIASKRSAFADAAGDQTMPQQLRLDLDTRELASYQAGLETLKATISSVSSESTGAAEAGIRRLAEALERTFRNGKIRTKESREEIELLSREAVAAAAAVAGVDVSTLTNRVKNAGDVGRVGVDKFSLALNQAAFAVDDFLSVSGGFEQRLRAVQNNLTQLAFIVGNTKGLFAALGLAIGAQITVAVLKATGVLSEHKDVIAALNDAFKEQQSRLETLAKAYDSLGESITNAGLNQGDLKQVGRQRQIQQIRRQEEEARVARAAAVDPEANRLRIEQQRLQRLSESSTDAGFRSAIAIEQRRIEQELERRSREVGQRQSNASTARAALERAGLNVIEAQVADFVRRSDGPVDPRELQTFREGRQQQLQARLGRVTDLQSASSELEAQIEELRKNIESVSGVFGITRDPTGELYKAYTEQLAQLTAEYASLEAAIRDSAPGAAFVKFSEALFRAADALDRTAADIEGSGLGPSSAIGDRLKEVNDSIARRQERAAQARAEGDIELLDTLTESIDGLQAYALELESAAAATKIFSDVLSRVSDELNQTVLREAQSRADASRRRANAESARFRANGNGVGFDDLMVTGQARREAEAEARRAGRRARRVEEQNIAARQQFERDALEGRLGAETQALLREREQIQKELDSGELTAQERQQRERRRREIDADLQSRFEQTPEGRRARARADAADTEAARAAQRQESERRGLEAIMSAGERAAAATAQTLQDIDNAFNLRERAGLQVTPEERQQARDRVLQEARQQVAPTLFALQDSVQNSILLGPSRAALNTADITTQQGAAELSRLIRGDDASRNQNLLELQKQTAELVKLNTSLENQGVAD